MGGFYVADKKTCEEFDMTMSKQQFYDLAGVPIRRIFEILAQEQGKTPDLDAMAARCKVRKEERVTRVPPARIEPPNLESRPASRPGSL
jgi:beta-phosphoglucomutase-like phosphatase (HAD superfamily)